MLEGDIQHQSDEDPFIIRAWRWWKVAWTVLRNLLYIFLILMAFDRASTAFETLVFCILILIYESVNWSNTTQLRLSVEDAFSTKRLLFSVLKKVGEETEADELAIGEAEKSYRNVNKLYYINLVSGTIVYCVVLWKLFTTLFG